MYRVLASQFGLNASHSLNVVSNIYMY